LVPKYEFKLGNPSIFNSIFAKGKSGFGFEKARGDIFLLVSIFLKVIAV